MFIGFKGRDCIYRKQGRSMSASCIKNMYQKALKHKPNDFQHQNGVSRRDNLISKPERYQNLIWLISK